MEEIAIHNNRLIEVIKPDYSADDIRRLRAVLEEQHTFLFPTLNNGLFPAGAFVSGAAAVSGYHHVWVRDNIFVAYAHYLNGKSSSAVRNVQSLAAYFVKYHSRFKDIASGKLDSNEPMNRPHVRFDGDKLEEVGQKWAHAQNDALGYFLWFFCKLASDGLLTIAPCHMELIESFVGYFQAIRFWEDEDSGHWEERRKIGASSIGVVVGALQQLKAMLSSNNARYELSGSKGLRLDTDTIDNLVEHGNRALREILPAECIQPEEQKRRPYDAALLFLVYPIAVVQRGMADKIIRNVVLHLKGEYGIRRYLGDSYWCADYKELLNAEERTKDFSDEIAQRDVMLKKGEEAQWCIFDPMLSAIYGERYRQSRDSGDLERQVFYFNRSIGQITPDFECPEAYYLDHGEYVPNDHSPLVWTQANLWLALRLIEQSLESHDKSHGNLI